MKPCKNSTVKTFFFFLLAIVFLFADIDILAQDLIIPDTLSRSFYDSLKVKAERRKLTSLLYDMIVVSPAPPGPAREKMSNTTANEAYQGKIINNIEIIRLDAFGRDIDNPQGRVPTRAEQLMNSTYTKTKRFVLVQHLLFSRGDTVSPLELADNERLLRELPFIDDARITVVPADSNFVDIAVIVREKYPMGLNVRIDGLKSGSMSVYTRNFAGLGHEMEISAPYDFYKYPAPGIGLRYSIRNIARSFSDLKLQFSDGLGITRLGGIFNRDFVTSETKYAWSASVLFTSSSKGIDTMITPAPLKYTFQDFWAARSFMVERTSVTRLIVSGRYMYNNVFSRPLIDDFSYYRLQKYQTVTGSIALTSQRFINTSLIYSYGRTEDIPYGYMLEFLGGREKNEFRWRSYAGVNASYGNFFTGIGYLYAEAGASTFYHEGTTEQGMVHGSLRYFTPLARAGKSKIRTFVNLTFTRGINRYADEFLYFRNDALIRGFRNDSLAGDTRIALSLEPVIFLPRPVIGFRFALFAFADGGLLACEGLDEGVFRTVAAIGAGIRIRNDQLVLNTLQIRLAWYPSSPPWSESSWITANSLVKLTPPRFEPDPPGVAPFN